ncbi:MAG: hypothetical protein OSJ52_07700 [Lachnospiraceae bacterium]|nr:hypothetical protein [Lachnospiraceae bacterium]
MKRILSLLLVSIFVFISPLQVQAATVKPYYEIFSMIRGTSGSYYVYDIPLMWNNKSTNGTLQLKINYSEYVSSTQSVLRGVIASNYAAWDKSGYTSASLAGTANATVHFVYPTTTYWKNMFGGNEGDIAGTLLYDSKGTLIQSASAAYQSTKLINRANIVFNPNKTHSNNMNTKKSLIHELGHVLCLGHPIDKSCFPQEYHMYTEEMTNITSIMHQGLASQYNYIPDLPSQYDYNAIKTKYGY